MFDIEFEMNEHTKKTHRNKDIHIETNKQHLLLLLKIMDELYKLGAIISTGY